MENQQKMENAKNIEVAEEEVLAAQRLQYLNAILYGDTDEVLPVDYVIQFLLDLRSPPKVWIQFAMKYYKSKNVAALFKLLKTACLNARVVVESDIKDKIKLVDMLSQQYVENANSKSNEKERNDVFKEFVDCYSKIDKFTLFHGNHMLGIAYILILSKNFDDMHMASKLFTQKLRQALSHLPHKFGRKCIEFNYYKIRQNVSGDLRKMKSKENRSIKFDRSELGYDLLHLGQTKSAMGKFVSALRCNPANINALIGLAVTVLHKTTFVDIDISVDAYKISTTMNSQIAHIILKAGVDLIKLETFVDLDPEDFTDESDPDNSEATLTANENETEETEMEDASQINKKPSLISGGDLIELGISPSNSWSFETALQYYEKIEKISPTREKLNSILGTICALSSNQELREKSKEYFNRELQISLPNFYILNTIAEGAKNANNSMILKYLYDILTELENEHVCTLPPDVFKNMNLIFALFETPTERIKRLDEKLMMAIDSVYPHKIYMSYLHCCLEHYTSELRKLHLIRGKLSKKFNLKSDDCLSCHTNCFVDVSNVSKQAERSIYNCKLENKCFCELLNPKKYLFNLSVKENEDGPTIDCAKTYEHFEEEFECFLTDTDEISSFDVRYVLANMPHLVINYLNIIAQFYLVRGRITSALKIYRFCVEQFYATDSVHALKMIGYIYLAKRQFDLAAEVFNKVLLVAPEQSSLVIYGKSLVLRHQTREALMNPKITIREKKQGFTRLKMSKMYCKSLIGGHNCNASECVVGHGLNHCIQVSTSESSLENNLTHSL